jgi:hypothetical protein
LNSQTQEENRERDEKNEKQEKEKKENTHTGQQEGTVRLGQRPWVP